MRTEKQLANLKPFDVLTEKEQRRIRSKGGKKSVEVRRNKKSMKEALEMILNLPITDKNFVEQLKADGVLTTDMTNNTALMYVAVQKALQGDTQAMNFVRDTSGQKPTDKIDANVNQEVKYKVSWK